jgi:hypothetical protein
MEDKLVYKKLYRTGKPKVLKSDKKKKNVETVDV